MIHKFEDNYPEIHKNTFVAESSDIIGNIIIKEDCSIWFGAVLRADDNSIVIEKGTNIQDNCVVHINSGVNSTVIGEGVTVGHSAIVHGCKVGNHCLIGIGAIILDGAEIGDYTIIGAGSLVTQGAKIPSGVLCLGSPAKIIRELSDDEKKGLDDSAMHYIKLSKKYR